jgi:hypothetical protein
MPKPSPNSYPVYFQRYIDLVPENDATTALQTQSSIIESFLTSIPESKADYAYAEGKWTLKELVQHMIDTERVFSYRALCFARGEKANLPPFEEDDYAAASHANNRNWKNLIEEFITVRKSTEIMFTSFTNDDLEKSGIANNNVTSVSAVGFMTAGHFYHHKKVIEERYL